MGGIVPREWVQVLVIVAVVITITLAVFLGSVPAAEGLNIISGTDEPPIDRPAIHGTDLSGSGFIDNQYETIHAHPGPPFVWHDGELLLNVTIFTADVQNHDLALCARLVGADGTVEAELECIDVPESDTTNVQVDFRIPGWPDNATGDHYIILGLHNTGNPASASHQHREPVTVITKDGDLSGDGLTNEEEVALGTDLTRADTSGNGLTDWEEVRVHGTDPLKVDTTGDGVNDGTLVRLGLNPTVPYLLHIVVTSIIMVLGFLMVGAAVISHRLVSSQSTAVPTTDSTGVGFLSTASEPQDQTAPNDSSDGLLSDEEVVVTLLQRNGGRLKQKNFVEQTEWSKAKVSRELTTLEEKGIIHRFRRGRENIVELLTDEEAPSKRMQ